METRLMIAYGLMAVLFVGAAVWTAVTSRRRAARKLRMRGIKSYSERAR